MKSFPAVHRGPVYKSSSRGDEMDQTGWSDTTELKCTAPVRLHELSKCL